MSFLIREKWVWIIIGLCSLVLVGPYALMLVIMWLPEFLRPLTIWMLLVSSGIAGGYKDWLMDKKKRESKSLLEQEKYLSH